MTPPSTGGCSLPSLAPSPSSSSRGSDPETNAVLCTEELEACIEAFLEEVDEDLEMNDPPLLKNTPLLLVLAPVVPGFVPFTMSTSQCCIPPKSLLRKVWHPYQDSVGRCHCEPGGWCSDLPCAGRVQRVPHKIRGHGSLHGGSQLERSCCSTDKEPCDQQGTSCGGHTPTHTPCLGSPEL